MGTRAQRRNLGPMRSICWTDHANWTKQQVAAPLDIDVKILRCSSEIGADGSEIRSLSGRNCRLADGTSRNPADRNEVVAQRTKDIEGIAGQVRNFNLDKFLSDCEDSNVSIPWAVGDDCRRRMLELGSDLGVYQRDVRRLAYSLSMCHTQPRLSIFPC